MQDQINDIDITWLKHYYLHINLFLIYMYSLVQCYNFNVYLLEAIHNLWPSCECTNRILGYIRLKDVFKNYDHVSAEDANT